MNRLAGASIADCETYQFNQGSTRLIGLVPDKDKSGAQKVRLVLEQQGALYDVRAKRYLGVGTSFETEIEPAVPKLFALVGSRINGLQLQAPSSAKIGEEVAISFRVTGGSDLRSVAKVIVTDAAGREVSVYGGNRDIVGGAGDIRFRTALNDPKRSVARDGDRSDQRRASECRDHGSTIKAGTFRTAYRERQSSSLARAAERCES